MEQGKGYSGGVRDTICVRFMCSDLHVQFPVIVNLIVCLSYLFTHPIQHERRKAGFEMWANKSVDSVIHIVSMKKKNVPALLYSLLLQEQVEAG